MFAFAIALVFPAAAFAAYPTISGVSPVNGGSVPGPFWLSASLYSPNNMAANAYVKVDNGSYVGVSVTYDTYWYDDGCDAWWETDYANASISTQIGDLSPGPHTITIQGSDIAGNTSSVTINVFRNGPIAFSGFVPAEGSRQNGVATISTFLSGAQVATASIVMTLDGAPVVPNFAANTISYTPGILAPGTHTVQVGARTTGGALSSYLWSFVVDTTPPQVTAQSPAPGAVVTDPRWGISVSLWDVDWEGTQTLSLDGSVVATQGPSSGTSSWTVGKTLLLSEGPHTAHIDSYDVLGNLRSYSWSFTVADPPRFGAASPIGVVTPTTGPISVTLSDYNDPLVSAVAYFDGNPVGSVLSTAGAGLTGSVVVTPALPMANGVHTVSVSVTDRGGNVGTKSWSFTVDAAGPDFSGLVPAQNGATTGAFTFTATADDLNAIDAASVRLWIDGVARAVTSDFGETWYDDGCGGYYDTDTTLLYISAAVPDLGVGDHTVQLRAADVLGNVSQTTYTFKQVTQVRFSGQTPPAGSRVGPDVHIAVQAGSTDVSSGSVVMRVDGAAVPTTWTPPGSGSTTGTVWADRRLTSGTHAVSVTAADLWQDPASTTNWSFSVDASSPAVTPVAPATNTTATALPVAVRASVADSSAVAPATIQLLVDGAPVTPTLTGTPTVSVAATMATMSNGTHTATVQAADVFGNTTMRSWSFGVRVVPTFGAPTPAPGASSSSAVTQVSVPVTGGNADLDIVTAPRVVIDGATVPATLNLADARHGTIVAPTNITGNAWHTVSVTAYDVSGASATTSWSFQTTGMGPTVTMTPANGATVTVPFQISVRAYDPGLVNGPSAVCRIDGVPVPASTWSYDQYWYDDGCEAYYADDPTGANYTYDINTLSYGSHTIAFSVVNNGGQSQTTTVTVFRDSQIAYRKQTPADGSKLRSVSRVSAEIYGAKVVSSTVAMKVDGASVTPSFVLPPSESATGAIWFDGTLGRGRHTAWVSMSDTDGHPARTASWSFLVDDRPPTVTTMTPSSPPTSTDALSQVGATLADDDAIDNGSLALFVDGTRVTGAQLQSINASSTRIYRPSGVLPEGLHTLRVDGADQSGNTVTRTWQVDVEDPPRLDSPSPGVNAVVDAASVITLNLWDANDAVDLSSIAATVDGRSCTTAYTLADAYPYTTYRVTVSFGMLRGSSHDATVTARDVSGHKATLSWSFKVASAITAQGQCLTCHTTIYDTHPFGCGTCHSDCSECHGGEHGREILDGCGCHPTVHPPSQLAQLHTSSATLGCYDCHQRDVTFEHAARSTKAGLAITCATCHASTDSRVKTALTNKDVRCTACHTTVDHESMHAVTPNADCTSCHASSLTSIHVGKNDAHGAPMSCVTCHGTQVSDAVFSAVNGGATYCSGCHAVPVHLPVHDSTLSASCASCHGGNLTSEHLGKKAKDQSTIGCRTCHTSADPKVSGAIASGDERCETCHGANGHDAQHAISLSGDCAKCHGTALTQTHVGVKNGRNVVMGCETCHGSHDTTVTAAISDHRRNCDACHGSFADHSVVHNVTRIADDSCKKCHAMNLLVEHVTKRNMACEACHGESFSLSTLGASPIQPLSIKKASASAAASFGSGIKIQYAQPSDVASAIANGITSCDACHAPMPHGIRTDCETCHGYIPPTKDGSEPTATAPGYGTWDPGLGSNSTMPTPHKGYSTHTTKCAVCHTVHKAPSSGEILLRSTAQAACEYCHICTDLGQVVVYGGDVSVYYNLQEAQGAESSHNRSSHSDCRACHSVHGGSTIDGAMATKILWDWNASGRSRYSTPALAAWPDPKHIADEDAQQTAWCTGCHSYYTRSYNETIDVQHFDHEQSYDVTWTVGMSHIMTDLAGGYGNTRTTVPMGRDVAWKPSSYCRSCHDAGRTNEGPGVHDDSFPHYTAGYFRFMTSAGSAVAAPSTNATPFADGLCLKCHVSGTGSGVGIDY